jgi:hypothetical protein
VRGNQPEGNVSDVSNDYIVEIASLSEASQQGIIEAVEAAEAMGTSGDLDVRELIDDAEAAEFHTAQALEYRREQGRAASEGNWSLAQEYAVRAQGEFEAAADYGASPEPIVDAQADEAKLGNARWEQRTANEHAAAAADFAAQGDFATAAIYSEAAEHHQQAADEHASAGRHAPDAEGRFSDEAADASADGSASQSEAQSPDPTPHFSSDS